jgi:hypothetical protein
VPDGETTPEQQISAAPGASQSPGKWVFTSLNDLDEVIRQWTAICDALQARRQSLRRTAYIHPPAADLMSTVQAQAFVRSLNALERHTADLFVYANAYTAKLIAARDKYASTEQEITIQFEGTHG